MTKKRFSFTFIVSVSDEEIFIRNFASSPVLRTGLHEVDVTPIRGRASASLAFNEGFESAKNEFLVFCHQDMIFPSYWLDDVSESIEELNSVDHDWGILGCIGRTNRGVLRGNLLCNATGRMRDRLHPPAEVQTLDEVVLIMRKNDSLRFDPLMPHFHFFGTDIVMTAAAEGRKSYAIDALCFHNTRKIHCYPGEFFTCYRYVLKKWKRHLPIYTTCVVVDTVQLLILHRRNIMNLFRVRCLHLRGAERIVDSNRIAGIVKRLENERDVCAEHASQRPGSIDREYSSEECEGLTMKIWPLKKTSGHDIHENSYHNRKNSHNECNGIEKTGHTRAILEFFRSVRR